MLHLSDAEEGEAVPGGCIHRSEFVNGPGGLHLADNDLRGFLDGRSESPWNQVGQSYTRVGRSRFRRRNRAPRQGEDEIFRTLQRWTGIRLPPGARIRNAALHLHAHAPVEKEALLYLYAVHRDWNPGEGGERGDNVSVPKRGEVWWREARAGEEAWGLPGAGFGAEDRAGGDTEAQPLAMARLRPGDARIELSDPRLAAHVQERVDMDLPLLFLLKLDDGSEDDEAGSLVKIRSGEFGPERSSAARPSLVLDWSPAPGTRCLRREVFLEHGREVLLGPVSVPRSEPIWVSFLSDEGFEAPTLEFREAVEGREALPDAWRPLRSPLVSRTGRIRIRAVAARDPIPLGVPFETRFHDTWVVSAPAEDQRLQWRFTSPSGESVVLDAAYEGGRTWRVVFLPDEPGRWRVRWSHRFAGAEDVGPEECFDVVAGDPEGILQRLRDLRGSLERHGGTNGAERLAPARAKLLRLERAAMTEMTPEAFRSEAGERLRKELDRVREVLASEPLPPRDRMTSLPLRAEAGGRRFREPIPACNVFRSEDYESPPPLSARRTPRRLWRAVARSILRLLGR